MNVLHAIGITYVENDVVVALVSGEAQRVSKVFSVNIMISNVEKVPDLNQHL